MNLQELEKCIIPNILLKAKNFEKINFQSTKNCFSSKRKSLNAAYQNFSTKNSSTLHNNPLNRSFNGSSSLSCKRKPSYTL